MHRHAPYPPPAQPARLNAEIVAAAHLRGEVRLAWLVLWEWAGGRPGSVTATLASLGDALGHDRRSARRWIERLAAEGLLDLADFRRGRFSVYVHSPAEALAGRVRAADPQRQLWPDEESGACQAATSSPTLAIRAAETAGTIDQADIGTHRDASLNSSPSHAARHGPSAVHEPPEMGGSRARSAQTGREPTRSAQNAPISDKTSDLKEFNSDIDIGSARERNTVLISDIYTGGSCARSAQRRDPPDRPLETDRDLAEARRLADQLEQRRSRRPAPPEPTAVASFAAERADAITAPDYADQVATRRERLIKEIRARVADPACKTSPIARVAKAVASGRLGRDQLDDILDALDDAARNRELTVARGAFFVGCAKRKFRDKGIDWTDPTL